MAPTVTRMISYLSAMVMLLEDAQFVANLVKERFGIDSFLINYVGSTIGAHSGPGTIALFYMGEYR